MIDKLINIISITHPKSRCVFIRKRHPELYEWVLKQPCHLINPSFSDRIFFLTNQPTPICKNSGCDNLVNYINRNKWGQYCSSVCETKHKGKHNSLISRDKAQQTSLKNWGVGNPAQHQDVRNKIKDTMIERYGVEFAKKSPLLIDKTKKTMVSRYGVEYAIQHQGSRDKMKKTLMEKYGVENSAQTNISQEVMALLNNPTWLEEQNKKYPICKMAENLSIAPSTISKYLAKYDIEPASHNKSAAEMEIFEFIKSKINPQATIKQGVKTIIYPFEIDIYIEEFKIGIEYNGSWYHSELNGKDRNYHINKTKLCENVGVRLIHIWEHEYTKKRDIILSKLNHICGNSEKIHARKCHVKELSINEASEFLNSTHIQGTCISSKRLGLVYNNEIVAVMTFGKTRFNKNYEWELLRYSSKLNHNVVGGFSKLLSHFINNFNPKSIITYSDKMWSYGDVYKKNNFKFLHAIPPAYFYTKDYINFENRINYQKKKLPSILSNYDGELTEWENMSNNGYDRVWNCGNDAWIWVK